MISFKDIVKKYADKKVLSNVSLTLPENKLIAFIGSNGAGKSTLISVLTRILNKDGGFVYIDNQEINEWNNQELAKRLSMLKQTNNLNVRLTVSDLVSFGRFPYSNGKLKAEDYEKIEDAINIMNIKHLENRYLDELSGGERQMAYIAMTIAQDTKYIFLDEPLNNLDMKHSVAIMKNLRKLVEEKEKTIFIVIHDINYVSMYADYVVAMKNGEIIKDGAVDEIITSEVLKQIYNLDISIINIDGKKLCLYYK